jgi:hypothetical protein
VEDKKVTRKDVKILQSQEEVMLVLENEFGVKLQDHQSTFAIA